MSSGEQPGCPWRVLCIITVKAKSSINGCLRTKAQDMNAYFPVTLLVSYFSIVPNNTPTTDCY